MMKSLHKISAVFLSAVLLMVAIHAAAFATPAVDPSKSGNISFQYMLDPQAVSEAQIELYYVAEISPSAKFTKVGAFENLPVQVNDLSDKEWQNLGHTLKGMTFDRGITPDQIGSTTDPNGEYFANGLRAGLWLVIPRRKTIDNMTYSSEAFVLTIPQLNSATDDWEYDFTSKFKVVASDNPVDDPTDPTTTRTAIKVWNDGNKTGNRPPEIVVTLYQNGVLLSPVQYLNAANNWRCTWGDLPRYDNGTGLTYDYTITEDPVPSGYTVSYKKDGVTTTITNSLPRPTATPGGPGPKGGGGGGGRYLPKTGQLLWPIPVLLGAGIIFLIIGVFVDQRRKS